MKFKIIISILLIVFCILCLKQYITCQYHEAEIDEYRLTITDKDQEIVCLYDEIDYLESRSISDSEAKLATIRALFMDVEGEMERLGYPEIRRRMDTVRTLFLE